MSYVIADMPEEIRPRERMIARGPQTLSDSELIALLLGSGMRGKNAIQLAAELLCDGMTSLRQRELTELVKQPGVGPAKATRLAAALEVARRIIEHVPEDPPPFDLDVFARRLVSTYSRHDQERLGVACVDSRHRLVDDREVFVGTINHAAVSPRDIVRVVLQTRGTSVLLYHNHPSGDASPSDEDITFTRRIKQSLNLCDVELIDHIVIGMHRYASIKSRL